MPAKNSRHVALTETLAAWIDSQVAKGEYTSTSDLIRAAIRVLRTTDEDKAVVQHTFSKPPARGREQA